ncbi:MAG: monovalent cation/H(+) antiporter subunit G [Nitrospiraceae bacterium]|nr:MAG: monovalent cation/H(+) antiporter subunit G [Nitrospiraceae bacterium]UCH44720.1 MAG: monovalent cation/H(+) antiporter subunit G [Nitrospiraceae bacterium]
MIVITIAVALIVAGTFFFVTATLGLLRFPDFYTRMHAAGKGDTLGALLSLAGLALYNLNNGFSVEAILISMKILIIALFIFIANPTATHAITKAGLVCSVKPWEKKESSK